MDIGEKRLLDYIHRRCGKFFEYLFSALLIADNDNFNKLSLVYPREARAVSRYQSEAGYLVFLEKEFKKIGAENDSALQE